MIGMKIRELRQQLGLSQQQLAGKSLSRAYICLIEKGKATPSLQALEVIAKKLGKPTSYFLEGANSPSKLTTIRLLLETAESHLKEQRYESALRSSQAAVEESKGVDDLEVEASARSLLAKCLYRMGELEKALLEWESALDLYKLLNDRANVSNCYFQMALCFMRMEELSPAARYHERALQTTDNLKSLTELRANILCMLGSTHLRLGDIHKAAQNFQQAVVEAEFLPRLKYQSMIGLGNAVRKMGNYAQAFAITQQVMSSTADKFSDLYWQAKHNLAVLEGDVGNWEQAYKQAQESLAHYQETGQTVEQASIMEEAARYFLHREDYNTAYETCMAAIQLLDSQDSLILRARLYRLAAMAQREGGNPGRARELFQLSFELFRTLKASEESVTTLLEMNASAEGLRSAQPTV